MSGDRLFSRVYRAASSVKLFLVLVSIVGVLGIVASILPQDRFLSYYVDLLGPGLGGMAYFSGLTRFFSSPLFLAIVAVMQINLMLCTLPRLFARVRSLVRGGRGAAGRSVAAQGESPATRLLALAPDVIHLGLIVLIFASLVTISTAERSSFFVRTGDTVEFRRRAITVRDSREVIAQSGDFETVVSWEVDLELSRESSPGEVGATVGETVTLRLNRPVTVDGTRFHFTHWGREDALLVASAVGRRHSVLPGEGVEAPDGLRLIVDDVGATSARVRAVQPTGTEEVWELTAGDRFGPFWVTGTTQVVVNGFQASYNPARGVVVGALVVVVIGMILYLCRVLGGGARPRGLDAAGDGTGRRGSESAADGTGRRRPWRKRAAGDGRQDG